MLKFIAIRSSARSGHRWHKYTSTKPVKVCSVDAESISYANFKTLEFAFSLLEWLISSRERKKTERLSILKTRHPHWAKKKSQLNSFDNVPVSLLACCLCLFTHADRDSNDNWREQSREINGRNERERERPVKRERRFVFYVSVTAGLND